MTVVHPGVVKTNLASSYQGYTEAERAEAVRRYNSNPGISPEYAASRIQKAILRALIA